MRAVVAGLEWPSNCCTVMMWVLASSRLPTKCGADHGDEKSGTAACIPLFSIMAAESRAMMLSGQILPPRRMGWQCGPSLLLRDQPVVVRVG